MRNYMRSMIPAVKWISLIFEIFARYKQHQQKVELPLPSQQGKAQMYR